MFCFVYVLMKESSVFNNKKSPTPFSPVSCDNDSLFNEVFSNLKVF